MERRLAIARVILDEEEEIIKDLLERGEPKEEAKKKAIKAMKEAYSHKDVVITKLEE